MSEGSRKVFSWSILFFGLFFLSSSIAPQRAEAGILNAIGRLLFGRRQGIPPRFRKGGRVRFRRFAARGCQLDRGRFGFDPRFEQFERFNGGGFGNERFGFNETNPFDPFGGSLRANGDVNFGGVNEFNPAFQGGFGFGGGPQFGGGGFGGGFGDRGFGAPVGALNIIGDRLARDQLGRPFELQQGIIQGQRGILDPAAFGFNYNAIVRQGLVPGQNNTIIGVGFNVAPSDEALREIRLNNTTTDGDLFR